VLVARRGCPRKILGKPGREDVSEQFSVQFGSDTGVVTGSPMRKDSSALLCNPGEYEEYYLSSDVLYGVPLELRRKRND